MTIGADSIVHGGGVTCPHFYKWLDAGGIVSIKSNQSNYFIVRPKVDQRAGQLSLPHLGITKTELKRETDEQISPVNHLEP